VLLGLQASHGNRVVARMLGTRRRPRTAVLQRRISITPEHYASGLGVNPAARLSHQQLREYLTMAVLDDYAWARRVSQSVENNAVTQEAADAEKRRRATWEQWAKSAGASSTPMGTRLADLGALIAGINAFESANMRTTAERYTQTGDEQEIERPNRQTRYATTPADDAYKHTSAVVQGQQALVWGTDEKMWEAFGTGLGPLRAGLQQAAPGDPATKRRKNAPPCALPLVQLPWARAKELLPRPLLNLIFDVRFQLESGGNVVIDERTPYEKERKDKSPEAPGTLRSWHQDSAGVLPGKKLTGPSPAHATALHEHYRQTSTTGAGSSIVKGATGPEGYAEYTGTGSSWEHNTKVVLDYVQKRVYLTLTHYQYWALIDKDGGGYEFWRSETQELEQAQGRLQDHLTKTKRSADKATMMSPWMEVLFT
jgi:hypothetical protein